MIPASAFTLQRLLLLALPALAGAVLVLVIGVQAGHGVTPDSVTYLSSAESLRDSGSLRRYDGERYAEFPPLYPVAITLAAPGLLAVDDSALVVNALAFGLVILLTGAALLRVGGSPWYALLGALTVLIARPVLTIALHLWSEMLFTAWAMLSLYFAERTLTAPATRPLLISASLASLAALTRYIGVTTGIVAVAAGVLAHGRRGERPRGIALALGFTLIPPALWGVRNLAVTGSLAGARAPAAASLRENLRDAAETLSGWLLPGAIPLTLRVLLCLLLVVSLLTLLGFSARGTNRPKLRLMLLPLFPYLLFPSVYAAYLLLSSSTVALDMIGDRLLAPIYPSLVVAGLGWARIVTAGCPRPGFGKIPRLVLIAGLVLWLSWSAFGSARMVRAILVHGIDGYDNAAWVPSELVAYARDSAADAPIYSNDPFVLWYRAGRAAQLSPRRYAYRSPGTAVDDLPRLPRALQDGPAYLLWFDGIERDFLLDVAALAAVARVEPVERLADGTVYRLTAWGVP